MAKAKTKAKSKNKSEMIGHNSDHEKDNDEVRKVAKAQRSADKVLDAAKVAHRESTRNLTARLEAIGMSRAEFKDPFRHYCKVADAEDDEEVKKLEEDRKLFLANQRRMYDALNVGGSLDWIDLIQDADQIRKDREEAERAAAEEAADAVEEPTDTPVED